MVSGAAASVVSTGGVMAASARAVATKPLAGEVPDSGLSITHYDNFNGHTVLIRNKTDQALSLQNIYPSKIQTPTGVLDLQRAVAQGNLNIPANTTQAISISDQGVVHQYSRWTHLDKPIAASGSQNNSQFVNVNGQYGAGLPTISSGLHIASIA